LRNPLRDASCVKLLETLVSDGVLVDHER
jgi:hypothetical protein